MEPKTIQLTRKDLQKSWDNGCSDRREALEDLYPDFFKKEDTYSLGDWLLLSSNGKYIIVALPSLDRNRKAMLISLKTGIRKSAPFNVKNFDRITYKEIHDGMLIIEAFTKIEKTEL